MPYYNCDGVEIIGVVTTGDCRVQGCDITDAYGVLRQTSDARMTKGVWSVLADLALQKEPDALDVIRAEIQRLDKAWEGFKLPKRKKTP